MNGAILTGVLDRGIKGSGGVGPTNIKLNTAVGLNGHSHSSDGRKGHEGLDKHHVDDVDDEKKLLEGISDDHKVCAWLLCCVAMRHSLLTDGTRDPEGRGIVEKSSQREKIKNWMDLRWPQYI